MGTLDKHSLVQAPPQRVYEFVADVRNAPHYITAIRQITSGPAGPPATGQCFAATGTFLGQPAHLTLRLVTLVPARQVVLALEGDPAGTLTITLTPTAGGAATQVAAALEVPAVPGLLLGAMMGGMLDESMTRLARAVR